MLEKDGFEHALRLVMAQDVAGVDSRRKSPGQTPAEGDVVAVGQPVTLLGQRVAQRAQHARLADAGLCRVTHVAVPECHRPLGLPQRPHDGKVITPRSDMRWCSDSLEIRCWSGERVHVAFSLDCCDREAIAWVAKAGHLTGDDIRDLMAQSLEARFGAGTTRTPHPVEWLSDNGPPYTAHATRAFGGDSSLLVCTTPAYSPESNGMAEAFVKTFRRDYLYLARLDDAATVLRQLPAWFDDYNENHPHRGLGMRSPRQYRARSSGTPRS